MADTPIDDFTEKSTFGANDKLLGIQGTTPGDERLYNRAALRSAVGVLENQIVVTQSNVSSTLGGTIESEKEYFIDGVIDMTGVEVEIPATGIEIRGYSFDTSKLVCSDDNYTMFKSAVGGSGNILGRAYAVEVTGTNSQVYDLEDATGFNAFEFSDVNYNDCTSLGEITGYRQGLENGTGRFGGTPELKLSGLWLGGYFIDTSIVRGLIDGNYSLFSAGAGFVMGSRFRTNQNVDLPTNVSFFDFSPINFPNTNTIQITGAIITRNFVSDASDPNITPNISSSDIQSNWQGNIGVPNTIRGGELNINTEVATTLTQNIWSDLDGTWGATKLEHFDNPANGVLRFLDDSQRQFEVNGQVIISAGAGDDIEFRFAISRDDGASYTDFSRTFQRNVNFQFFGDDRANLTIFETFTLGQTDRIKLQVRNISDNTNVTGLLDSYYLINER